MSKRCLNFYFYIFQREISSLQERLCGGGWEVERARLVARLEQRDKELRAAHDQRDVSTHQHDLTKKEVCCLLNYSNVFSICLILRNF